MSLISENTVNLEQLIENLPEVYQSIYLGGELVREGVRGNDFERLEVIKNYIKPNQTILDIGSNIGFFTINLAKLFPDNIFVSVESQYSYVQLQQELIKLEGVKNIILIHSTMSTEWLVKAAQACTYFDVTLLLSILHHIPDAGNFLTQLGQVSKSLIMELPHPDELKVCGKNVLKEQLTVEKISQVKPVFTKLSYESTTHCDDNLKRSFYYADSPNYHRTSIYPYIGYPQDPRDYDIQSTEKGLLIKKTHLDRQIDAIPGILLYDIAQIGSIFTPSYGALIQQIENEFDRLEKLANIADIRPWNMLFTANGLRFIDCEYTPDLDPSLIFDKSYDFKIIKDYLENNLYLCQLAKINKRIIDLEDDRRVAIEILQEELYRTNQELSNANQELSNATQELGNASQELSNAQSKIASMESTKFWQLRQRWFQLKKIMNIEKNNEFGE